MVTRAFKANVAFQKRVNSELQKPANVYVLRCLQSSQGTSLDSDVYCLQTSSKDHNQFVICNWWILIHFVCFCVSRFVACDCNYKN